MAVKNSLKGLIVGLLCSMLLVASPAMAHNANGQDGTPRQVSSPSLQIGTSFYRSTNVVVPYFSSNGQHYAAVSQRHSFTPGPSRTLEVRTAWYCVKSPSGQTVAWPLYGGTPHGPAGGGGQFEVSDPPYTATGMGVEHCRTHQFNTEVIERSGSVVTARRLVITQLNIPDPFPAF